MRETNTKVHINQLVGKYMTRMIRMNDLMQYAYAGSSATSINIVIDIYSIKNSILGVDFEANGYDLCSAILDLVVHYKNYFRGLGVDSHFILMDSNNRPARNIQIYPNYNSSFAIKTTCTNHAGVKANLDLLSKVCSYIPNVQYICTKDEIAVALAFLLSESDQSIPAMIISRDMYISNLFDTLLNITWLYPSKYNGQDNSWICTHENVRGMVFAKVFNMMQGDYLLSLPLNAIFAATKFPARDLQSILQYRTLVSKVNNNKDKVLSLDDIASGANIRRMMLDISLQLESYRLSTESRLIKNAPPKLYDTEGLKLINNELFNGVLQLDDLLR